VQEALDWFSGLGPALTHLLLGLSSLIEYVFPPFPGDTITLAGAALAATAGLAWWSVWAVLTLGSTVGGVAAWAFGRSLGRSQERWPSFLRTPNARVNLETLQARFEKRGAVYLAINRFVPAFRSLFFVAAGVSGLPLSAVVLWGGLSAALWNGVVLAVGFSVGTNIDELENIFTRYQNAAYIALGVFGVLAFLASLIRRRSQAVE
jgi:membrane protein DedA with SNARE-associated domain